MAFHTQMSLLVHATCSVALSFSFCCRLVDGVAMLSVVKRNILKGKSPSSLGGEDKGETGWKIKKKKYKRERLLGFVLPCLNPLFAQSPTHPYTIGLHFYCSSLTSAPKKIVSSRFVLPSYAEMLCRFNLAPSDDCACPAVKGCSCFLLSSVRANSHLLFSHWITDRDIKF